MHTSPFRDTVDISEPYMVGFASLYPPHPMVLLSSIFKHFFEELGMIHAESVTFLLTDLFLL